MNTERRLSRKEILTMVAAGATAAFLTNSCNFSESQASLRHDAKELAVLQSIQNPEPQNLTSNLVDAIVPLWYDRVPRPKDFDIIPIENAINFQIEEQNSSLIKLNLAVLQTHPNIINYFKQRGLNPTAIIISSTIIDMLSVSNLSDDITKFSPFSFKVNPAGPALPDCNKTDGFNLSCLADSGEQYVLPTSLAVAQLAAIFIGRNLGGGYLSFDSGRTNAAGILNTFVSVPFQKFLYYAYGKKPAKALLRQWGNNPNSPSLHLQVKGIRGGALDLATIYAQLETPSAQAKNFAALFTQTSTQPIS